jgi:hypothetical protein
MSTWIALAIAIAAIVATYVFCVRPGLRGQCAMSRSSSSDAETERQLAKLREELRVLRAHDSVDSGRVPRRHPAPPADA